MSHSHLEVKGSTFNCVYTNKMSNPADVKQQKQAPLGKWEVPERNSDDVSTVSIFLKMANMVILFYVF